jgi:hypothetical protein
MKNNAFDASLKEYAFAMWDGFPLFDMDMLCRKCTSKSKKLEYRENEYGQEFLRVECLGCGYRWHMKPADHKGKK